jgi:hypothetical protein
VCPRPKWITSADKRMCRASCKETYKCVTRQQRMGEQSRLTTWPDVNVLSTLYSYQTWMELEFFWTHFLKILHYQISSKSIQREPSCGMRTEGQDEAFRNFPNAPTIKIKKKLLAFCFENLYGPVHNSTVSNHTARRNNLYTEHVKIRKMDTCPHQQSTVCS